MEYKRQREETLFLHRIVFWETLYVIIVYPYSGDSTEVVSTLSFSIARGI